eukprot:NODE_934_length_2956_cov_0.140357.p1 type:complete len:253 gc:universal NODE_934_length_2956_cov_0.140357:1007-249(-)
MDTFCSRKHGNKGVPLVTAWTPIEKQLTKDWLLEFALINGEKKPGRRYGTRIRDVDFIWLPATFTLKKLHELFLLQEIRDISFETFRKLYHKIGIIKIRSSRSDMCDTCIEYKLQLSNNELSEFQNLELANDYRRHLLCAMEARLEYNRDTSRHSITHLSFDYSQNMILPQLADQPSELYFMSLLNINLFGIHNETNKKQMNYIYREDQGKKGSNNVASMLIDYIFCLPPNDRRHLVLHADNCVGQKKTIPF